jgi:hypothetical protein
MFRNFLAILALLSLGGSAQATDRVASPPCDKRAAPQLQVKPSSVAPSLPASDWTSIRAAYEAARHGVTRSDKGGYRARNYAQQWLTEFDGHGFIVRPDQGDWRWGLELTGYGFAGEPRVAVEKPQAVAEGQRLTYRWDERLAEWFLNDGRGLEHGFRIETPPGTSERADAVLELELAVRGELRPKTSPDGSAVAFIDPEGRPLINYQALKVWDADGKPVPARFACAAQPDGVRITLAIDGRGARYPLMVDPIAQQAYLKASNVGTGDNFGTSVAISGDTVVVGAPQEDSNATGVNGNQSDNSATDSGAAYVFVRSGTTWTQQAYLKASNTDAGDSFGQSVAISGNTIIIGAQAEDSNATGINGTQTSNTASNSGAAYVFVRSGSNWTQEAYLKASNTEVEDLFGYSVALSGDTVVVGAPGEDSSATGINGSQINNSAVDSGAAYVFVRNGTNWTQQAYLKASNAEAVDIFGVAVAISGETIVAGAFLEDSSATGVNGDQTNNSVSNSGAAYVFVRSGSNWTQQAYLKASNTGTDDQFGFTVGISGNKLVVGAPNDDSNAGGVNGDQTNNSVSNSGAAYVFVRNGNNWIQQAYLKASHPGIDDSFGYSVAIASDTVIAGAVAEDSNATGVGGDPFNDNASNSGAAYLFAALPAVADYPFQSSYTSAVGSPPVLKDLIAPGQSCPSYCNTFQNETVNGITRTVLAFPTNNGLALSPTTVAGPTFLLPSNDSYRIEVVVRLADLTGYKRILDLGNGTSDSGLYFDGGRLEFYPYSTGPTVVQPNSYVSVVLTRDALGRLTGYVDGVPQFSVDDSANRYGVIDNNNTLRFFQDNVSGGFTDEASAGAVAQIRIWPGEPWLQQAYLKASNASVQALFGWSVALSESSAVVGAYSEGGTAGAAYVFEFLNETIMSVTSSSNPSQFGQNVTFTAVVGSPFAPSQSPTGTVTFKDGSTILGVVGLTDRVASLTTSGLSAGTHPITAEYSGDLNFHPSSATLAGGQTVNALPTTLANISTRLPVQTGDNALIGGFIITGTQPKKVIIRAIGPSLPFVGALADPTLELYQGGVLVEANDNWVDSPNKQAIIDSTIPPSNDREAAIVRTLAANGTNYTAIVRGVNNGTGIGVVEAYDLDRSVDSKLANISTRGFVQTGDSVLIAGTIIVGQASQKVIIRAIGPSLSLPGKLADPTLQLVDGNGAVLEENDNWVDSPNKQAIIDSTIPPSDNNESAIVRTLPANGANYTAIVRGVNDTTGIAVVEIYALN